LISLRIKLRKMITKTKLKNRLIKFLKSFFEFLKTLFVLFGLCMAFYYITHITRI